MEWGGSRVARGLNSGASCADYSICSRNDSRLAGNGKEKKPPESLGDAPHIETHSKTPPITAREAPTHAGRPLPRLRLVIGGGDHYCFINTTT